MKDTKLIFENWKKYQEIQKLDEGAFESFKGALAKLGSMDDLVAVFSKKKRMEKEAAEEYIQKIFDKKSSEFLRKFREEMDEEEITKGFPNNKEELGFNFGVVSLDAMYDSIKAGAEKGPDEEGHVPIDLANEMISDLRDLVEFYSDKKLADVYKHFNEEQVKQFDNLYVIYEQEFGNTNHTFHKWLSEDPVARFQLVQDVLMEQEGVADSEEEEKFFKKGDKEDEESLRSKAGFQDKGAKDTKAMQGLKSGKLPLVLGLLGGGFSIAHALAMASGMGKPVLTQAIIKGTTTKVDLVQSVGESVEIATSENGLLYMIGKSTDGQVAKTVGDFTKQLADISSQTAAAGGQGVGIPEVIKGFSEAMPNPEAGSKMLTYMSEYGAGPGANENIFKIVNATRPSNDFIQFVAQSDPTFAKEIAQGASGAGTFKGGLTNVLGVAGEKVKIAAETLTSKIETVVPALKVGGSVVKLSTAGAIVGSGALGMIGAGLFAASAGVTLARLKGQKSSRAQKLNDLFQKLQPLEGTPENKPLDDTETPEGEAGAGGDSQAPVGGFVPQADDQEVPPEEEKKRKLVLVRMDDDGIKFHPGRKRKDREIDQERDTMQSAQDQAVTGRKSNPSSDDVDKKFGRMAGRGDPDAPLARTIKKAQGKSKALVEPYITIDGSIYTDMAKAFKQAGLIKTARLNNNLRKAIKDISDSFVQAMSKDTKPQKLTYKQAQVRVTNKLKRHNLPSVAKNSKAMFTILRVLKSYGMIRGDIPEDPIADTPVNEVKTRKQLREWRKLAHLFKK